MSARPSEDVTDDYRANARLPRRAGALAEALVAVHRDLAADVELWLASGGQLDSPIVEKIELEALFQQRIYRKLARDLPLSHAVISRLDGRVRRTARANTEAGHRLARGLVPLEPTFKLKTSAPDPPHRLLALYKTAERRFGVAWQVLASVNFVESRFGRMLGPSSAGALGPMQFLPSTWEQYGAGGNILDPRDAILAAARYLSASGAPGDTRAALFAYNRSDDYVEAVMTYANEMSRRPNAFYEYYFWQVFVRTTKGDDQLTGPGAKRN